MIKPEFLTFCLTNRYASNTKNPDSANSVANAKESSNYTISSKQTRIALLLTALIIILFDQISKIWASANLNLSSPVNVFGSYFRLFLAHNFGIIWGIPIRSNLVYFILPMVGIVVVLYIALKTHNKFHSVCYGLLLGGAIGNLLDRIRLGYVIDFIDMGVKNTRWPTYNIADLAIDIGLIMLIAGEIFIRDRNKKLLG